MCASSCNFRFATLGFLIVLVYIGAVIFHNTKEVLKYEMGEIIFYLILSILQSQEVSSMFELPDLVTVS